MFPFLQNDFVKTYFKSFSLFHFCMSFYILKFLKVLLIPIKLITRKFCDRMSIKVSFNAKTIEVKFNRTLFMNRVL
ncbi:hypothetical protein C4X99_08965 [Leptospira interrogans serovar Geyaweera]|nr:hypothetical protein C5473_10945 [Leptospira interrogans serovar Weerasinghe]KAA1290492.1 hypothetical protein C4X99_08965 [Leptospira interrogans serovar Geyaweera]OOB98376.1 hypothetical protein B0192_11605 [Leptospira interrogans serovar Australis]